MPILRNLCILPRLVSQERDEELEVRFLMVNSFMLNLENDQTYFINLSNKFKACLAIFQRYTCMITCNDHISVSSSQAAFACSKLRIETLEQGVKYVQS